MKVSIITVNLNNADGLKKTLESVRIQTDKDFEYIVIDGGSTDSSLDFIEEYSAVITKFISELDTGVYNAMNKGIKLATGDFCLFLNSGDYLYDEDVLKKINKLNLKDNTVYYTDAQFIKNGVLEKKLSYNFKVDSFFFASFYALNHQNTLISRDLFNTYGYYDESLRIQSDWYAFLIFSLQNSVSFNYIKDLIISVYDLTGISSNENNVEQIKKEKEMCVINLFGKDSNKIMQLENLKENPKKKYISVKINIYKLYLKLFLAIMVKRNKWRKK